MKAKARLVALFSRSASQRNEMVPTLTRSSESGDQGSGAASYRTPRLFSSGVALLTALSTLLLIAAPTLAADRAYELVSPPDKNGGNIVSNILQTRPADDGNSVMYTSTSSFAQNAGAYILSQYIAKRTESGWSTHGITPQQHSPKSPLPPANNQATWFGSFSPDLDKGIFYSPEALSSDSNPNITGVPSLYLGQGLADSGGTFTTVSDATVAVPIPPLQLTSPQYMYLVGATPDFGQILFESKLNLTPDAPGDPTEDWKLYEWDHGTLRLAGILPDGTPSVSFAGLGAHRRQLTPNMISRNGSRVFFGGEPGVGDINNPSATLYMRENHATTTQINISEKATPDPYGPQPAELVWTTPDGSKVFFMTREEMTDGDTNTSSSTGLPGAEDLYMYEPDAPVGQRLTLISEDESHEPSEDSGSFCECGTDRAIAILGVSEDGDYVYFMGDNRLTPGIEEFDFYRPSAIYVWHNGAVKFIDYGELSIHSTATQTGTELRNNRQGTDVRVTPSGVLAYASAIPHLGGYDNISNTYPCGSEESIFDPEPAVPAACDEVYVYKPTTEQLICASCNPTGVPPDGNANFTRAAGLLSGIARSMNSYQSRAILDDGSKVFFSSRDALVSRDSNGAYDAYEYDTTTGEVALLSSGQCGCDSLFVNASTDGRDVFFTTTQQLVRIDSDNLRDLYDARVGGGIPAQNAPPPTLCQGDGCQSPPVAPIDPTPSSSAFSGTGDTRPKSRSGSRCRHPRGGSSQQQRADRLRGQGKARRCKGHVRKTSTSKNG